MSVAYKHYGRGGAGNVASKAKVSPDWTPAPVQVFTSPRAVYRSGRGGAGNKHSVDEMPSMTPEQYLQEVHDALDIEPTFSYGIGRGGSGNIVPNRSHSRERDDLNLSSRRSEIRKADSHNSESDSRGRRRSTSSAKPMRKATLSPPIFSSIQGIFSNNNKRRHSDKDISSKDLRSSPSETDLSGSSHHEEDEHFFSRLRRTFSN